MAKQLYFNDLLVKYPVMPHKKNTQIGNTQPCFDEPDLQLAVIDLSPEFQIESHQLSKLRVHFFFSLNIPINFRFSPFYSRKLEPEKIFIIYNPDKELECSFECLSPSSIIWLHLSLQKLHQLYSPETQAAPIFNPSFTHSKSYEEKDAPAELMVVLNQVLQKSKLQNYSRLFFQAKILEIFSLLYSEKTQTTENCPFLKNETTVRKIKAAKEILIKNYRKPPTIPELAKQVQLNEFQLKTGFKEIYGQGPYHFLMAHKLELAKQLLSSGNYQVQEAAFEIGYSNTSHFIEAFKKQFGVTPKKLSSNS